MLEHVTRELNIEALPTDIPENIVVDVSGLDIAGTLPLSALTPPEGVTFLDDPDETVIATVVVPTEVEEPEIEEETELVGEDEARPRRGAGAEEGEAARGRAESAEESRGVLSLFRRRRRRREGRLAGRRARQPGRPLRAHPPQRRLRGRALWLAERWGLPKAKKRYAGLYSDGRAGPGGPARRGPAAADLHERRRPRRRPGPRRARRRPRPRRGRPRRDRPPLRPVQSRLGGGLAGHNGLKSLKRELGGGDFQRIRVGVGPARHAPTPRSSPATCWAASRESPPRSARARGAGRGRARPGCLGAGARLEHVAAPVGQHGGHCEQQRPAQED